MIDDAIKAKKEQEVQSERAERLKKLKAEHLEYDIYKLHSELKLRPKLATLKDPSILLQVEDPNRNRVGYGVLFQEGDTREDFGLAKPELSDPTGEYSITLLDNKIVIQFVARIWSYSKGGRSWCHCWHKANRFHHHRLLQWLDSIEPEAQ